MLICIAVVVCFFIYHYNRGTDVQDPKAKIQKLHLFYVSGILVFIIVELVTGICMGDERHSDILSYVNFAATLSSLIMSVVAIIFTIVSGSRGDEQYKKIDNASDKVAESLAKFSEKTSDIDASIATFKSSTDILASQMDTIIELVNGGDRTSKTVLDHIQGLQNTKNSSSKEYGNDSDRLHTVQEFVNISSYSGKLALYACVLSKDTSTSFSIKGISENGDDEAYKYGYIIASVAAGIINIKPSNSRNIEVESYIKDLKPSLELSIQEAIDSCPDERTKDAQAKRWDNIKMVFEKQGL